MNKIWLKNYPKEVAHTIDPDRFTSITELFHEMCRDYRDQTAYSNYGSEITYEDLNYLSQDFASFLQNVAGLKKGDRVIVQLPNILQYPVVLFAVLRAGLVVVNTNPQYSSREMKHQYNASGARAAIVFEGAAAHLEEILPETKIETVVLTNIGDLLGWPKSMVINGVVKYVKKMIPKYNLPKAYSFYEALDLGRETPFRPVATNQKDIAFLQFTGGTTGVSKGAMLSHRNVIANVLQMVEWMKPLLIRGEELAINALPLYHIFSLTLNAFALMYYGVHNVLITDPRDIAGFIKIWKSHRFTVFPGLNTLFAALLNHKDFASLDFSTMKVSVAGGMALQKATAQRWTEVTQSKIVEGYGLTETSPVVCCNPIVGLDKVGTIGLPLPSTEIKIIDDKGQEVLEPGERGELCVRGPQVMEGYWQHPEETAQVMLQDGWLKTGDVAVFDLDGFIKIVDRKKDMILVSGFNVYPNEVEDVVASHAKVKEVAAIGVPDSKSGEVVKVFVVKRDETLTAEELIAFCHSRMTNYKVPKHVEFRSELPKSNVGKILRRTLKEEVLTRETETA